VHLKLIFGTHDSVIKIKDGERFAFKLNHKKSLYKLPSGHQLMNEETVKFIANNNIWPS
jgi:pimeloyl-ACP methyl ester carboxylesterase